VALHFDSGAAALPQPDLVGDIVQPQAAAGADQIALTLHDSLEACATVWRAFEALADHTVFQTHGFLSAWFATVGAKGHVTPAIVIGRSAGGDILFLLPLAVERRGFLRRLTWLGSDLCDYNAPLLAPAFAAITCERRFTALWQRVRAALMADRRFRHDTVVLEKMPETVGGQRNPFTYLPLTANPSGAYVATLFGDWESYYAEKRSSGTRKNDRAKRRKLGDLGEVRFVEPTTEEDLRRTLAELFRQKSAQFARMGVADLFARPGCAAFFLALATDPATRSTVHVSRLDVGETMAATNFGLVHGGRYYHILAAYSDGEVARFGPGAAHLRDLLRIAIERGCREFDFTIGDEPYKREWSDRTLVLHDFHAAANPAGWLVAHAVRSLARVKRTIKQTPALWNAFTRTRALGSRLTGRHTAPAARSAACDTPPESDA